MTTARALLLAALRVGDESTRAERLAAATAEAWQEAARLARQHSVAPWLYRQLRGHGKGHGKGVGSLSLGLPTPSCPAEVLQSLRVEHVRSADRNMRLYHALADILRRFDRATIPVIPLKGAYLAERVYGSIAARPMGDVDLLVQTTDLARVDGIMAEMGFVETAGLKEPIKEAHHFGYKHATHGLSVEIHWDLIESVFGIRVDLDALWERAGAARLGDIPVRALSPEDQILHLCVHTSMHAFELGLRAMCDLTETLRCYEDTINWESLRQRAHTWNADRCAYVNLQLARALLNAPVSDEWLDSITPPDFDPRYLSLAEECLFATAEGPDTALPVLPQFVEFWADKRVAGKCVRLLQSLFPPRRILAKMYPASPHSWRIFLYYPVRIKDVLKRHGRGAWHLLRGDAPMIARAERQHRVNALRKWLLAG